MAKINNATLAAFGGGSASGGSGFNVNVVFWAFAFGLEVLPIPHGYCERLKTNISSDSVSFAHEVEHTAWAEINNPRGLFLVCPESFYHVGHKALLALLRVFPIIAALGAR